MRSQNFFPSHFRIHIRQRWLILRLIRTRQLLVTRASFQSRTHPPFQTRWKYVCSGDRNLFRSLSHPRLPDDIFFGNIHFSGNNLNTSVARESRNCYAKYWELIVLCFYSTVILNFRASIFENTEYQVFLDLQRDLNGFKNVYFDRKTIVNI